MAALSKFKRKSKPIADDGFWQAFCDAVTNCYGDADYEAAGKEFRATLAKYMPRDDSYNSPFSLVEEAANLYVALVRDIVARRWYDSITHGVPYLTEPGSK